MDTNRILTLLSQLTPEAVKRVEEELRCYGLLTPGASLVDAFNRKNETRDEACCDKCDKAFDEAFEKCKTDKCKAGAALAYARCLKKCGYYD